MIHYNTIAGQKIERIEALSDGVFSIAMTLLVFDLKDPVSAITQSNEELLHALLAMSPKFLTYFLSFITLGIFWMGHSTQFSFIKKYDRNLNWISLFFLLFVSLLPFSTGILSDHFENSVAVVLYWMNIALLGLMLLLHWNYAFRQHYIHAEDNQISEVHTAIRRRIVIAQSLYFIGMSLAFINTYLSVGVIIAIQVNYALGFLKEKK